MDTMNNEQLKREILAQMQLQQAGSVMARPQLPEWRKRNPALDAVLSVLDLGAALGPSPVDAFGGKAAKLAEKLGLAQLLQALLGGGGPSGFTEAHVPRTYRNLGLSRTMGDFTPEQYVAQLQAQPNYERYLHLVQSLVRRTLGETFPVARGAAQTDPLIKAVQQGAETLPVTAVTHAVNPRAAIPSDIAETFASRAAEGTRKPAFVAQGVATPEDVTALVPRRGADWEESELVLAPQSNLGMRLTTKYIPPSGAFPVTRKPLAAPVAGSLPDEYIDAIVKALNQAAQTP